MTKLEGIRTGISVTYRALLGLDMYTAKRLRTIPTSWSVRICILTVCLFGLVNLGTFYAGLASRLTIESPQMPINSLKDVATNPNYHLAILKGTKTESFFSDSNNLIIQTMWKNRENKIIFHTDESEAENQILFDPKLVYVGSQSFEDVAEGYPCKITQLREKYARSSYGFGFSPNSSYLKLFNFRFAKYKSMGIKSYVKMSTEKASTHGCDAEEDHRGTHWHALGYSNIFIPFGIIAVGTVVAIASFLLEKIMYKVMEAREEHAMERRNTLLRRNTCNADFVVIEILPLKRRLIVPNIRRKSI